MRGWKENYLLENNRALSMLGIAKKASKIAIGYDPVIEAIMKGNVVLVLFSSDISPKSAKGITLAAEYDGIPVVTTQFTMEEIGFAIGKRSGILGLTDLGIANKLEKLLSEQK